MDNGYGEVPGVYKKPLTTEEIYHYICKLDKYLEKQDFILSNMLSSVMLLKSSVEKIEKILSKDTLSGLS